MTAPACIAPRLLELGEALDMPWPDGAGEGFEMGYRVGIVRALGEVLDVRPAQVFAEEFWTYGVWLLMLATADLLEEDEQHSPRAEAVLALAARYRITSRLDPGHFDEVPALVERFRPARHRP